MEPRLCRDCGRRLFCPLYKQVVMANGQMNRRKIKINRCEGYKKLLRTNTGGVKWARTS